MVLFFTITLIISIACLALLLLLKQVELSTGSVIFAAMRPKVNRFFKTCLVLIERVLPALVREGIMSIAVRLREGFVRILARVVLRVETFLHESLRMLREKFNPHHARGEASAFLKEVGQYKEELKSETEEDRALY